MASQLLASARPVAAAVLVLTMIVNAVLAYLLLTGQLAAIEARLNRRAYDNSAGFALRQTLFENLPVRENAVVFAGDSITAGCEWDELLSDVTTRPVLNRGIGGDTSVDLLRRVEHIGSLRPFSVWLMVGTNDTMLDIGADATAANIAAATERILALSPHTTVYVQSILPAASRSKNTYARAVNRSLQEWAEGRPGVVWVDLWPAFARGDAIRPELTSDGLHLNGNAYLVWKRAISPYLREAIARRAAGAGR